MIFLFAQAGIPFTSGFNAKFGVIAAAVDAERYWVAIVAVFAAVIGAFLYLKILVQMFLEDPDEDAPSVSIPAPVGVVLAGAVFVTILFGIFPGLLDGFAQDALVQLTTGQ